jgi:uncharacterized protein YndB with AHSA1/START domain
LVRPIRVTRNVDVPREVVFDYLADVANHAEFTDHFLTDFRLERLQSRGVGAAYRYRLKFPLARMWGEVVVTEAEDHHRITLEGQTGRLGRIKTAAAFTLTRTDHGMTKVEYEFESFPATRLDRLKEALGLRAWLRRNSAKALRRLARTLEHGEPSMHAARVAAG